MRRGYNVWLNKPEMVPFLRDRYAAGETASEIRHQINRKFNENFTRNAICGKIERLGLERTKKDKPQQQAPRSPPRPQNVSRETFHGVAKRSHEQSLLEALGRDSAVSLPPDSSPYAVPFQRLRKGHCRWPIDQPSGPIWYCGAEKLGDYPYCGRHCQVAYRAVERRRVA